jgi:hypothetical protein
VRFDAISPADRAQVDNYVRRTLEPPDPKLAPLHRSAARSAATGLTDLRAAVTDRSSGRRDHFRVRDLSEAGAFLYPKPVFEHALRPGTTVGVLLKRGGVSLIAEGTVQRAVVGGSLEAQLFPHGFAVAFDGTRPALDEIERLLRT